mgnify:CR=1 FL=1
MHLNVDRALVVANTLRNSDIVNDVWCMSNPLWFMALRDEDIPEIHTQIWKGAPPKQFALYAKLLSAIETEISNTSKTFSAGTAHALLMSNETARTKFYKYVIAVFLSPGLRTVDTSAHDVYVWANEFFTGEHFSSLYEFKLDSSSVVAIAASTPSTFYTSSGEWSHTKSRLTKWFIDTQSVRQLVTDDSIAALRDRNPAKFVYGIGWSTEDRGNSFFYGKAL